MVIGVSQAMSYTNGWGGNGWNNLLFYRDENPEFNTTDVKSYAGLQTNQ